MAGFCRFACERGRGGQSGWPAGCGYDAATYGPVPFVSSEATDEALLQIVRISSRPAGVQPPATALSALAPETLDLLARANVRQP